MNSKKEITRFKRLLKTDRNAAVKELALAVIDSFDLDDFRAYWVQINLPDERGGVWRALHELSDEDILDTMIETKGWNYP